MRKSKSRTIDSFFQTKNVSSSNVDERLPPTKNVNDDNIVAPIPNLATDVEILSPESRPKKFPRLESTNVSNDFERDPGLRPQIWEYLADQRDEIRRRYINAGPYQCILSSYPKSGPVSHPRRFQSSWFELFKSWLEYSPTKDAAFCLPCFLFNKSGANSGQSAFTIEGFRSWRKVRNGKDCVFLNHVGSDPNSCHRSAQKACEDLMNQPQHIQQQFDKCTSQQIEANRMRLRASIDAVLYLTLQGCALRGHDESINSKNRGNFIELVKRFARYNANVADVVLDKAPLNASYTSPMIQKQILHVVSKKVRRAIFKEIGDAKFCVLVDEARDESKKEQMAIILRFVDSDGLLQERFFGLVHVSDTKALTLKNELFSLLSHEDINIHNIRGQGYDGASNMRGEFNGLQALVAKECPYAYYVHCFAHRLQLALVAVSKDIDQIQDFFDTLTLIVNSVGASCKRVDELKAAQASEIAELIAIDELETGTGLNQIGTLQRAGDTRWSSHLKAISSLMKMFNATSVVLSTIGDVGDTSKQRLQANAAYESLNSFEFVLILHLMKAIFEITEVLCQALQRKSQDILNAMHLVLTTKALIQKLRDDGWEELLITVKTFCERHGVNVPDMTAIFVGRKGKARHQPDSITVEQHYRVNIFIAAIDFQLKELNYRFNDNAVELLTLSSALDPREMHQNLRCDDLCMLVDKFYPEDFTEQEKLHLKMELQHYKLDVTQHPDFCHLSTISELSPWLVKTRKSMIYPLISRLIRLVLTLPVSTATTERAFSAMKMVKTQLRNKMDDDFLTDSLIVHIEKDIVETFTIDSIIDDFRDYKERRVLL